MRDEIMTFPDRRHRTRMVRAAVPDKVRRIAGTSQTERLPKIYVGPRQALRCRP